MDIIGYVDRHSVAPGDSIRLMTSSKKPTYRASLIRLRHGDENPEGPGHRYHAIPSAVEGEYQGREQGFPAGSYVAVPHASHLDASDTFTLAAWIWPTAPTKGEPQGIITKFDPSGGKGYGLFLGPGGDLQLWIGGSSTYVVATGIPIRPREWYLVTASVGGSFVAVSQNPARTWPGDPTRTRVTAADPKSPRPSMAPLIIAGCATSNSSDPPASFLYNGKIDDPCIFEEFLEEDAVADLEAGEPEELGRELLGLWRFTPRSGHRQAQDLSSYCHHGELVNMPMQSVTGRRWSGHGHRPADAPNEFSALWFHEDDLEDANWDLALAWRVPEGFKSGAYAIHLEAGSSTDDVPFFVRAPRDRATAELAFLAPTFSYLAYGNEHGSLSGYSEFHKLFAGVGDLGTRASAADHFLAKHRLLSIYDPHTDGSGNCYSSRLRPILTMRPNYRMTLINAPHQFAADLYLIDWLEEKRLDYDVITDDDVHEEQHELLLRYRVVITGSHPEYWTGPMLDALEYYLDHGGRLVYLGGNGLYWVTSVDPDRPHVIEVRRGFAGSRGWESLPGENYHSTTGELGGLWRYRHRAPQWYTGVGFTSQGGGPARPFLRTESSRDARAAFIFEGVGEDPIGDTGLVLKGAGGYEIDRADQALGTPPHALVVATATGFTDHYQSVVEEVMQSDSKQAGTLSELVRADMVFFEMPEGGAVFSAGSIAYSGALSARNYDNPVSRITENVVRRFLDSAPFF